MQCRFKILGVMDRSDVCGCFLIVGEKNCKGSFRGHRFGFFLELLGGVASGLLSAFSSISAVITRRGILTFTAVLILVGGTGPSGGFFEWGPAVRELATLLPSTGERQHGSPQVIPTQGWA